MRWDGWKGRDHASRSVFDERSGHDGSLWRGDPPPVAIVALMAAMVGLGCRNQFFEITSDTDPDMSLRFTPSETATVGAGPSFLGVISGDMGRARYRADSEKRMFLLDSTLEGEEGAFLRRRLRFPEARAFIRLPASDDVERTIDVAALDRTKPWQSARLYDAGMCSALAPLDWPEDAPVRPEGALSLVAAIPEGLFEEIAKDDQFTDPVLHGWSVEPILRMVVDRDNPFDVESSIMRKDADALEVRVQVRASEIGRPVLKCINGQVNIRLILVLEVTNRVAVDNRACLNFFEQAVCPEHNLAELTGSVAEEGQVCSGGSCVQCFWVGDDPRIGAVRPRIVELDVSVTQFGSGRCRQNIKNHIIDSVTEEIDNLLRDTVERQVSEALLHTSLSAPPGCRADCECVQVGTDGRLIPGARFECGGIDPETGIGSCRVVAEADRIHLRPDSIHEALTGVPAGTSDGLLEIVVAENQDDIQASLLLLPQVTFGPAGSGCAEGRASWPAGEQAVRLSLNWPFTFGALSGMSVDLEPMAGTEDATHGGATEPGRHGRGPGTASPPGRGEGLDRGMDHSRGRGTGEAPASGGNRRACEPMCDCLAVEHDVDPGECFAQCTELTRGMPLSEQEALCKAAFVEAGIADSTCRQLCDGFGTPGAGER
jgi:hypothetical protein